MPTKSARKAVAGARRGGAPKGNKNALGNRGGTGAPTKYNDTFPDRAERLALLGLTDEELAIAFGVSETTINAWKLEHVEFSEALNRGKLDADAHVAQRLYRRALGYSHEAVKIFMPSGAENPVYAPYTEHYPPDTAAARHWLNNRRPKQWRERIEHAGDQEQPVRFVIDGAPKA